MRRAWGKRLLALAAVGLWLLGWGCYARLDGKKTHLVLERAADAQQVQTLALAEAQREAPSGFCFWGRQTRQVVYCPQTGRQTQVTVVYLAGNPALLGWGDLSWQPGCLVDDETAQALFGTAHCGAQTVRQDGQTYPVLAAISAREPTLVRLARPEDGPVLDRCVLVGGTGEEALLRWEISGKSLDLTLLLDMLWNGALLLPGTALAVLAWRQRGCWRQRPPAWGTLALTVLSLAGLAAVLGLVRIPPQMIPTKWSDFEFWGRWWREEQANLERIFYAFLGSGQLQMLLDMVKSMACWGVSFLAGLLALMMGRKQEKKEEALCASC